MNGLIYTLVLALACNCWAFPRLWDFSKTPQMALGAGKDTNGHLSAYAPSASTTGKTKLEGNLHTVNCSSKQSHSQVKHHSLIIKVNFPH